MEQLRVRDIMTADVTTLKRNDKLTLADDIMNLGRIRHLPVLDDDEQELVGMVSQRDLFRGALAHALGYGQHAQRKVLDTLLVKEVMTSDVITTTPDTPLVDAARVLVERKIGCLPVLEKGRLVGIVTESDFVAMVARGRISS
jgi:CBS domain-containing protein